MPGVPDIQSSIPPSAKKKGKKGKPARAADDEDWEFLQKSIEENKLAAEQTKTAGGNEVSVISAANFKENRERKTFLPGTLYPMAMTDNSNFRLVDNWAEKSESLQNETFEVPIAKQYPNGNYPLGQIEEYGGSNACNISNEEKRAAEMLQEADYADIRHASEAHRQVRRFAQSYIKPGMKMIDICQRLESKTLELLEAQGLERGWGFPTGVSLNNCAAHYTPNGGDNTILKADDIMKLDFGTHVRGRIIDCACTYAFNSKFDPLIEATKDATNRGLQLAGIDARFMEIGREIEEVITSYEVEINGKVYPVKPIRNLNGHSIERYKVHGGKSVPIVKNTDSTIMEEGEIYAIETFASTGKGYVNSDECSHYMKNFHAPSRVDVRVKSAAQLLQTIDKNFSTLAFCRRWLDDLGHQRHLMALKCLVDNGIVDAYPALLDVKGSFTSQMEHTVLLRPTCKEILSRGDDF